MRGTRKPRNLSTGLPLIGKGNINLKASSGWFKKTSCVPLRVRLLILIDLHISYFSKPSPSSGRIKKASVSRHRWVVKIMSGSRLLCAGTAISRNYVLTTASCLLSREEGQPESSRHMKYLQLVETDTYISLYRVVLHHQWGLGLDLALIQTATPLSHVLCLTPGVLPGAGRAVQVGFKVGSQSSEKQQSLSLFRQNVTLPPLDCQAADCWHLPDLSKWVT